MAVIEIPGKGIDIIDQLQIPQHVLRHFPGFKDIITKHFRYHPNGGTKPYETILRVGFPLHKPYPYS